MDREIRLLNGGTHVCDNSRAVFNLALCGCLSSLTHQQNPNRQIPPLKLLSSSGLSFLPFGSSVNDIAKTEKPLVPK